MRLISTVSLLLLLAAYPGVAAPMAQIDSGPAVNDTTPATTIETIVETVTKTQIIEVTEATVPAKEEVIEPVVTETKEEVKEDPMVAIDSAPVANDTVPATTIETIVETVTKTQIIEVTEATVSVKEEGADTVLTETKEEVKEDAAAAEPVAETKEVETPAVAQETTVTDSGSKPVEAVEKKVEETIEATVPEVKEEATVLATEATVVEATNATVVEATEATVVEATEATVVEASEATVVAATEATVVEAAEATVIEATEATVVEATEATVVEATEATEATVVEATEATVVEATEATVVEAAETADATVVEATEATVDEATETTVIEETATEPTIAADAPKTTIETIVETVTRTIIHQVTTPSIEEAIGKLDNMENELDGTKQIVNTLGGEATVTESAVSGDSAAAVTITEISGQTKMCTCEQSDVCQKESTDAINECMQTCDEHLQTYANQTESYFKCFSDNTAAILEAEECMFKNKTEYCSNSDEVKFVNATKWHQHNHTFSTDKAMKDNIIWKRYEGKYNTFQNFYHCTKRCMHKKFHQCTSAKGCAVKMPKHEEFADKMKECTKKNYKITNAIRSTCVCLAWTKGVKELQGSCVFLGNQYYADRV